MAGSSHRDSLMVFMLFVSMTMFVITAKAAAAENHTPASPPFDSSTIPHDDTATATKGEFISGKMSFSEEWKSGTAPSTCTCTCYPGNGKAPPKSSTPSSVRSPSQRQRSPPPSAPYNWPSNSPSSPVYAPTTRSPSVSFAPPPPMNGDDVPSYEQPAPFVASPQTFVPSPPPPPPVY